jgi:hypothetical protein
MLERINQLADPIGAIIGFVLTIMVLSYIIGDNVLFRLAISIFIGAASGYAAVLILYNVLWHQVLVPVYQIITTGRLDGVLTYATRVVPAVILGIWMLTKVSPRLARWGTPVLAFLTGVGAATVVAGAVRGTIFPQVGASVNLLDTQSTPELSSLVGWFINGLVVLVGTVTTLIYFQLGKHREEGASSTLCGLDYTTAGRVSLLSQGLVCRVYISSLGLGRSCAFLWDTVSVSSKCWCYALHH